jgi:hypothetical protein
MKYMLPYKKKSPTLFEIYNFIPLEYLGKDDAFVFQNP